MAEGAQVYADRRGEIIDHPSSDLIELVWFADTADMSKDEFQDWLSIFAGQVEKCGRTRTLVDGVLFLMSPANMDEAWRDANIIPRYNAAGITKFAFLFPAGMPSIGQPPRREGPGQFPTAYFGTRQDAVDWLTS
jgi:hypothetical protein